MPWLFGTPGRGPDAVHLAQSFAPACISKEFAAFAANDTAPVIGWLKALAVEAHERCGGPGVGAVGMCLTGGFALGMMVEPAVIAPVLSQPSLPLPFGGARRRSVHLSAQDARQVRERAAAGVCVLGLRFTEDRAVPGERFAALRELLGENFVGVEIDSSPGNPYGNPRMAHSVLTEHLVDTVGHPTHDALEQVLSFFKERLLPE
jgi:dienelactone hydrolase